MIRGVVLLRHSRALSVCRPSPAAVEVDFALGCLMLHWVIRLFNSLVIIALLWRFGALSVCRLSLAVVAVEFALSRLVLLSNCRSCIRFASLSCRVIWSFCRHCFITTFGRSIYVNVSWTPLRLRLRVDWKGNRSLNTLKYRHGQRSRFLFVCTQSHFSPDSSPTPQTRSVDLPLVYLSNSVRTSSFFCRLTPLSMVISTRRSTCLALLSCSVASINTTSPPISRSPRCKRA